MPGDLLDPRGDLDVGGRHDLRAVAEIDLVAVVLRRIVRCGDHDAGHTAEMADAECHHRRRQWPWRDHGLEASTGHDLRRVSGEDVGVVPGIEADDHLAASQAMIKKVAWRARRRPGRRRPDSSDSARDRAHRAVRPCRTGVGRRTRRQALPLRGRPRTPPPSADRPPAAGSADPGPARSSWLIVRASSAERVGALDVTVLPRFLRATVAAAAQLLARPRAPPRG